MPQIKNWAHTTRKIASDAAQGFIEITHNSLAIVGLIVASAVLIVFAQPELRAQTEAQLRAWLQDRHVSALGLTPAPEAIERATAANPQELPEQQSAVAYWISKKYRVAPEPIAALVAEAYELGAQKNIDPTLLLAVMAVESSFNPFAQSSVGAQGLMQVMTRVHTEKYENFGGTHAAFDPISNLRVGAAILENYIKITGSVEGGLRYYVGAANLPTDGGYTAKVLAEYHRLRQVADVASPAETSKQHIIAKRRIAAPSAEVNEDQALISTTEPPVPEEEQITALNSEV